MMNKLDLVELPTKKVGKIKGKVQAKSQQHSSIKIKTENGHEVWINEVPAELIEKYQVNGELEIKVEEKNNRFYFLEEITWQEPEETQTFSYYLNAAHKIGLKEIHTELIEHKSQEQRALFRAIVKLKNGSVFTAFGDADPSNTTQHMQKHYIRFAETRAIARALRFATNEGRLKEKGDGKNEDNNH